MYVASPVAHSVGTYLRNNNQNGLQGAFLWRQRFNAGMETKQSEKIQEELRRSLVSLFLCAWQGPLICKAYSLKVVKDTRRESNAGCIIWGNSHGGTCGLACSILLL